MSRRIHRLVRGVSERGRRLITAYHPRSLRERGLIGAGLLIGAAGLVTLFVLMFLWGREPDSFDVRANAQEHATKAERRLVTGYVTGATLVRVGRTLLDKAGGYLSNDVMPPGAWMDNIPSWEFGVLVQVRDLAKSLRNDMSRSQSQSVEDKNLAKAEPRFNYDNDSWVFPTSEGEYRAGLKALDRYLARLADTEQRTTQFYARADNLRDWLSVVEKRLGSLSQRLSASVGQTRVNTDLAGDSAATQATGGAGLIEVKTPWLEVDNVFYEARGATWALVHFLRAVEIDFQGILSKKNALVSLRQIIRELQATQEATWSPMVLNGSGFGFVTNYSLIMASYISRANAGIIDLRNLLLQG